MSQLITVIWPHFDKSDQSALKCKIVFYVEFKMRIIWILWWILRKKIVSGIINFEFWFSFIVLLLFQTPQKCLQSPGLRTPDNPENAIILPLRIFLKFGDYDHQLFLSHFIFYIRFYAKFVIKCKWPNGPNKL